MLFPEVTESDLDATRMKLNGSVQQIAHDIKELETLGVTHANFGLDFGTHSQTLTKIGLCSSNSQGGTWEWEVIIMVNEIKSSQQFEQEVLNSANPVFVDFWAEWCAFMQGRIACCRGASRSNTETR